MITETDDPPRITQPTLEEPVKALKRGSVKTSNGKPAEAGTPNPPPTQKPDTIAHLKCSDLHPFADQPRKSFPADSMKELADSIKANGIVTPLLVRPRAEAGTTAPLLFGYEIICGERRWRAAEAAGLDTLPCIVRPMDDKTALEIAGLENLQREGLPAYEEALWIEALISKRSHTVESLAAKLGKSRAFIFHRRSLARVSPPILEALREGEIEATVAQLIGTIPDPKQQEKALEAITNEWNCSFDDAKEIIEQDYRKDLKGSCFDRNDDNLLSGVPSCELCPKRSGNIAGYDGKNPLLCTDPACYGKKVRAHVSRKTAKLEAQGLKVLPASEAKKMESRWSSEFNPERAGYVSENTKVGNKTIGDLVKKAKTPIQPCVALDSKQHNAHVIFKIDDIKPILKEQGIKSPAPQVDDGYGTPAYHEKQRKEREEAERNQALSERALTLLEPDLLKAARKRGFGDLKFWRFYMGGDFDYDLRDELDQRDSAKKIAALSIEDLFAEFIAAKFLNEDHCLEWNGTFTKRLKQAAEHFGIDVSKYLAQAKAESKAKEAKPAATAKPEATKGARP